jgi:hypothetical protein
MLGLGAVLVVLLVGIGVWILGHRGSPAHSGPPPTHSASSSASSSASVLAPSSAHGFDALSSPSDDPGNENDQLASLAIDGNPSTSWNTQFYIGNPVFGGTKTGTGLILDMGRKVKLASVQVTFGSIPGADVQIKVGNSNARAPSTMSSFTTVASATDVGGVHTFTVHSSATGRYVLIWFTKLPPKSAGSTSQFQAKIYNVIVRGSH